MQRILGEAQFNAYANQAYCHSLLELLLIDLIREAEFQEID